VASGLILESTFLIDLERGFAPALNLLELQVSERFFITPTIAGEVAAGDTMKDRRRWQEFIGSFHMLPIDEEATWQYGVTFRYLQANGMLIGTNDLWIAAVALANGLPVASRNTRHFTRVPGLDVRTYEA
jgi:predicted nucleic acid-binding protein